jgi:4-amino-4-deoxy-L-arabinose transferase-like glycosyltransferase
MRIHRVEGKGAFAPMTTSIHAAVYLRRGDEARSRGWTAAMWLLLLALIPRLGALLFWIDSPGDGPARAMLAYDWFRSPHVEGHGIWLPGFMYLAGAFHLVVDDPAVSTRILNVLLGTVTIPIYYLFVRSVYGRGAACFSAAILALLPLHVALSASSLTEVSVLFEVVAGTLLLMVSIESVRARRLAVGAAVALICLAIMTRYEAWLLVPLFPGYYFLRTRNARASLLILALLAAFPLLWLTGNRIAEGSFFRGYGDALRGTPVTHGSAPVNLLSALKLLAGASVDHLGWILPVAIVAGAVLQLLHGWRRGIRLERTLHLLMTGVTWAFLVYVALVRGWRMRSADVYFLFGFAKVLPFAVSPYGRRLAHARLRWSIVVAVGVMSVALAGARMFHASQHAAYSPVFVTQHQPIAMKRVATWLRNSQYRDATIIITHMDWQSTYLPLYFPEVWSRAMIVSTWTRDADLRRFVVTRHPTLLITRAGDPSDHVNRRRVLQALGTRASPWRIVHAELGVTVYVIES